MVGSVRDELTVLLPELPSGGGTVASPPAVAGSQTHLFEQLLGLLASAGRARPLVLVVEDFHWADRSTCDFMSFLVSATRREPIALIVTYRSDELRPAIRVTAGDQQAQASRLSWTPFGRAEIGSRSVRALANPTHSFGPLVERSEGNPFFTESWWHRPASPANRCLIRFATPCWLASSRSRQSFARCADRRRHRTDGRSWVAGGGRQALGGRPQRRAADCCGELSARTRRFDGGVFVSPCAAQRSDLF